MWGERGRGTAWSPSLCLHSVALTSAQSRGLGGSTVAIRESPVYLPGKINVWLYYIFSKQEMRKKEISWQEKHYVEKDTKKRKSWSQKEREKNTGEGSAEERDKSYSMGVLNKYGPSEQSDTVEVLSVQVKLVTWDTGRRQPLTQEISILKLQAWLITLHPLWFSRLACKLFFSVIFSFLTSALLFIHTYTHIDILPTQSSPCSSRLRSFILIRAWEQRQSCYLSTLALLILQPRSSSSSISIHDKCDIYDFAGRYCPRGTVERQHCSWFSWQGQYILTAAGLPIRLVYL